MQELLIPYKLEDGAKAPTKSHFWDAGWDFYANEDVVLPATKLDMDKALGYIQRLGSRHIEGSHLIAALEAISIVPAPVTKVNLGVSISIPQDYLSLMLDRSGMGIKCHIGHVAGVIDCGYTGELTVGLINFGKEDYHIKSGDKVIQMVLFETPLHITWEQRTTLEQTERGDKGFGSTGK